MNGALLRAHHKQVIRRRVEIEAATARQTQQRRVLVRGLSGGVLQAAQLQLRDILSFRNQREREIQTQNASIEVPRDGSKQQPNKQPLTAVSEVCVRCR